MSKKKQKCFYIHKNQSNSYSGGLGLLNTNLVAKNLSDERLKVYKSIFRKCSTLMLGLETTLMGELKSQEFIFEHENSLEWTIEGLYVDFAKNVNFNS